MSLENFIKDALYKPDDYTAYHVGTRRSSTRLFSSVRAVSIASTTSNCLPTQSVTRTL